MIWTKEIHLFKINIFTFTLPLPRLLIPLHVNRFYHTCTYNRLPEDEPSVSKHVEDIVKIKTLV
jgi:hypothetical protein